MRRALWIGLWTMGFTATAGLNTSPAAEPTPGNYASDLEFLKSHIKSMDKSRQNTALIELFDSSAADGPRVAVSPAWQGRVMTSTARGPSGTSFGWLNRPLIETGKPDLVFNNYGGEDRFWIAPEAGQFALFFAPGAEQKLPQWITPPGLNEGEFETSGPSDDNRAVRMRRQLQLVNASSTRFHLEVDRQVRLLDRGAVASLLGESTARAIGDAGLAWVGFSSESTITNRGPAWNQDTGLLALWMLGQFKPGPRTVIVLPYQGGPAGQGQSVVNTAYFQALPDDRLKVTDQAVLFLGDGNYRSKIGLAPARARPVIGAIDLAGGILTLVHYSLPADAASQSYVDNLWNLPQANPYSGDAVNSYNDGPAEPGADSLGGFFELETLSPTRELASGASLSHTHTTIHVEGDLAQLKAVARAALGIDLDEVARLMFPK